MVVQEAESTNTFFALLRSGLYGTPIPTAELPESIDWKTTISLARKHTVLGIIIDSIQYLPENLRPSSSISARLGNFALAIMQANMIVDKSAARLVAFFKGHGIEGVLLKGQGVARYYRVPQLRQSGDIDFYVGIGPYEKSIELSKAHLITEPQKSTQNQEEFAFYMDNVVVELHRVATILFSPIRRKRFQKWIVEELEQSPKRRTLKIGSAEITLPSYDFDAIFVFYHAWRHYVMEGIGLRQLCDWTMIFRSHSSDIDPERLTENLRRFGLTKPWKLFACIAVNYLGLQADLMPLYDPSYSKKAEKILKKIVEEGNFGRYSEDYDAVWARGSGFWHAFSTVRVIAGYSAKLMPIMPFEAIALFFNYLVYGALNITKQTAKHIRRSHDTKKQSLS
ncbi:MAG: nucleotidyltransferase family protein [Muribaculaceae bacterium]|nr:nucleotidyltransferase family protein [Muribaculaceae bacterium]